MNDWQEWILKCAAWLVAATWQSALLVVILIPVSWLAARWSRTACHGIWLLAIAKVFLPTTLSAKWAVGHWGVGFVHGAVLSLFADPIRGMHGDTATGSAIGVMATPLRSVAYFLPPLFWVVTASILLTIWLGGMIVYVHRTVTQQARLTRQLRRSQRVTSGPLFRELEMLAGELGLSKVPRLFLSASAASPFLCSLHSPAIVLPSGLPGDLDREQLRLVLLHELVHLRRGDLVVCWLQVAAQTIMWFNPMVRFANRRLEEVREWCVDAEVLALTQVRPAVYGETILSVVESLSMDAPLLALAGRDSDAETLRRRLMQLAVFRPESTMKRLGAFAAVMLLALEVIPMTPPSWQAATTGQNRSSQT